MANETYTIPESARTTADPFVVPGDEDAGAGDDSFRVEPEELSQRQHLYVQIVNQSDVNIDVTLRGSSYDDETMLGAVDDGGTVTVSSMGGTTAFDSETGYTFSEVKINPASTPTSGNFIVVFQARDA